MRSKHFLLLSASLVWLFSCEGVATDATPAPVHLVLDIEAPAPEFIVVIVPSFISSIVYLAGMLHHANGWPAGGLQEDWVTTGTGHHQ